MNVDFTTTREQDDLIRRICERLEQRPQPKAYRRINMSMDLAAACNNGNPPMNLQKLLDSSDFDFVHDLDGISNHISHETGKIGGCFLPRCAR